MGSTIDGPDEPSVATKGRRGAPGAAASWPGGASRTADRWLTSLATTGGDAVRRVLRVKARLGLFDQPYVLAPSEYYEAVASDAHAGVAQTFS